MPIMNIANAVIEDIFRERGTTFITVVYTEGTGNRRRQERIRLVVGSQTVILNENGFPVPASMLRVGMTIHATVSTAMTRSIPPQANAFLIRIVSRR